jgi:hypothetical protein
MAATIVDLYNSYDGKGLANNWKAAGVKKDVTPYSKGETVPGKDVKAPYGNADDAVLTDAKLKSGRTGDLGSNPRPITGYTMPGYGPGDSQYSKKIVKK